MKPRVTLNRRQMFDLDVRSEGERFRHASIAVGDINRFG
jgi:hypothetical protein